MNFTIAIEELGTSKSFLNYILFSFSSKMNVVGKPIIVYIEMKKERYIIFMALYKREGYVFIPVCFINVLH